MTIHRIVEGNKEFVFRGPSLELGKKKCIFYFAAGGVETLVDMPFATPVIPCIENDVRVFSLDIPFHGKTKNHNLAIQQWYEELLLGHDPLTTFFEDTTKSILQIVNNSRICSSFGLMGLSRGAFIALHLAKRIEQSCPVVGFAPLIDLFGLEETKKLLIKKELSLFHDVDLLCKKPIRLSIGNNDTRVGTKNAFLFLEKIVEKSVAQSVRSCQIELYIHPSIGHKGHGTSTETFYEGTQWLLSKLE